MTDIIVIGGGHAGIEASLAASRMKMKTVLFTLDINTIGHMPCNPSIGGPAKGIVVREIDALGGEMAKAADKNQLQMKMLNTAKGPGVQSLRAQIDRITYPKYMQEVLLANNIEIIESTIDELIVENNKVIGVIDNKKNKYYAKGVIVTTGTYMQSTILVGDKVVSSGPDNQPTSANLSNQLAKLGFNLQRLKTGTPARIKKDSIDFSKTIEQPGTDDKLAFSYQTINYVPIENQLPCYLTYTNETTHNIIKDNLHLSSMYSGVVKGVGPRYCPSIEDKIVRFSDKQRHQLFLEPESKYLDTIYVQGLSTSLPHIVQDKMLKSIAGLENVEVVKYAYAIEYEAIDPTQLKPNLETKLINNLYMAGQINGTSGYEEAACQGLMAGINASLQIQNKDPLILSRDEAYIGVLIDDLVTKGTNEPYRLLTSRAEYRLLLRHDNADLRLTKKGYQIGLIDNTIYQTFLNKKTNINHAIELLKELKLSPSHEVNNNLPFKLTEGISGYNLLKRPEINYKMLASFIDINLTLDEIKQVEIEIKYEGYIVKARKQADKQNKLEEKLIPETIDYDDITNLALEAREKLKKIRPKTIGQATRISGINPSDISVLLIYLKLKKSL